MLTKLIDRFKIKYLAGAAPKTILLKDTAGNIGTLVFYHDASSLPPAREIQGFVTLNYYLRDFKNVLSLLNIGLPVYLHYAGTGKDDENGVLIGEDEPGWLMSEESLAKIKRRSPVKKATPRPQKGK